MIPSYVFPTGLFEPLSGTLNQRKYLPVKFMPITSEPSLVDDSLEPIRANMGSHGFVVATGHTEYSSEV